MTRWGDILDCEADFDPALGLEVFARAVPGRWAVYLLADALDRPVQLVCAKNLRESLKRRLVAGETVPSANGEQAGPSRKVDYRQVVRRVHWRRVDSDLEADWVYFEAARAIFPQSYTRMLPRRPAWFIHVDPHAEFPRFVRTSEPGRKAGIHIGPLEDKHAAGRLIELMTDAFDLCRYHDILKDAPNGRACAYKEIGKCPAPCDGSISMESYRGMVRWSVEVMVSPGEFVAEQAARMRAAAASLRFETAAKIKAFVDQLNQLGQGPFRHLRRLEDFRFLSVQRGPRARTAKLFVITPGGIADPIHLIAPPQRAAELIQAIREAARHPAGPVDDDSARRLSLVSHHLFSPKAQGVFVPLDALTEDAIAKAYQAAQKQKPDTDEDEGVLKEMTAPEQG